VEELRLVMKTMKSAPDPISPHGDFALSNEGHYWAGRLDEVNGDLADALKHYQMVLDADKRNVSAAFQHAYVSEMQGNHDAAAQGYAHALSINAREEKSLFNLGLIQFAQGKFPEAEKNFAAAAAAGTKFVKAWDRLGMTQEQLHQPDKALASYAKAREAKETDTYAQLRTAHILFDQQKWGAAAGAAKKAREAGVDSVEIYLIEADSYCHTHSYLQAWDLAHRGTEINPKVARLWAIMVESSQKLKNLDRAKQELAKLQTLDPEAAKLLQ
jgi:tetratricopeptide (TPR) repeat protein